MLQIAAVLGLAILCGAWVLFQRWLGARDPELGDRIERSTGCCGGCEPEQQDAPTSAIRSCKRR